MSKEQIIKKYKKSPKMVGQDSIIINAPVEQIWPLIKDSKQLENWGPPVEKIDVDLLPGQEEEGEGSLRMVKVKFSEKKRGWYKEIRTEQIEGRKISFLIYEDSFGMGKMLTDVGASMEVVSQGTETRFIITFYQRPRNILGWIMHPMILVNQGKDRKNALLSLKQYVEMGQAIKY